MKKARAATTTIDWLQLPEDILLMIVRRLDHFPTDHARFGAVCKLWRSVAKPNRCHLQYKKLPGLMVPGIKGNSLTRRYFLLLNHEESVLFEEDANSNKQLEVPHVCVCRGSAYGWLLLVGNGLNTRLFNPFTNAEIQLPSVETLPLPLLLPREFDFRDKHYVKKTVFSSNPSCFQQRSLVPPLVILIIYGDTRRLAYCKPGDEAWTALECYSKENGGFRDAIYYNDRFLALGSNKEIVALDIGTTSRSSTHTDDSNCEVKVTQYACVPGSQYLEHAPTFLVELQGDLVALTQRFRIRCNEDDDMYDDFEATDYRGASHYGYFRTSEFRMLRFETNKQKWVEVKSLGNNVLFLGYNTSFSLRTASDYLGCIPNSIYFTNNISEKYWYDMGIYNLTDKSISRLYRINDSQTNYPSPIWVERDPWLD